MQRELSAPSHPFLLGGPGGSVRSSNRCGTIKKASTQPFDLRLRSPMNVIGRANQACGLRVLLGFLLFNNDSFPAINLGAFTLH